MATRNERKAKAKARHQALLDAIEQAFKQDEARKVSVSDTHPTDTYRTVRQKTYLLDGTVIRQGGKRKFKPGQPIVFEPLKGDRHNRGRAPGYFGGKPLTKR